MDLWALIVLPLGLGLLGFVEPCTVGSSLLFVKYLEGKETAAKLLETGVFAVTRAVFNGALGGAAALVGSAFLDVQRGFWVLLGAAYILLGLVYLAGQHWLDRLAGLSSRMPFWTGVVFVVLGLWSIYFGMSA